MAFDADRKVTAMDHQASAGWPTLVMAPGFMEQGLNGQKYDEFAISGADTWYDVGAQRVRALSNDVANSAFRPGWLRSVGSERRLVPEFGRRSKAPSGCSPACGSERQLGRDRAEGYRAWRRDHVWTRTQYADLDCLRGARAGR